jgi:DNA-binding HxlR family transcriptional regulator
MVARGKQAMDLCPRFHRAVELIGRRWTGAILRVLERGALRFSEVASAIPGISDRLLSERLRQLEKAGLVERRVEPGSPVRVFYELTERGRALQAPLDAIARWAERWLDR